jgi:hypothetical protein
MHDLEDPANIVSQEVVESSDLLGKECIGCLRILGYEFFDRDSSYRDGRKDLCTLCAHSPRLSIEEHTARLRESNNSSYTVRAQRWEHQDEIRDERAAWGRFLSSSDLIKRLRQLIPSLYVTEGRIAGDLAIFQTAASPRPDWSDRNFRYLFYCPTGILPEYSLYEFESARDVPVREKLRGWRTVLLRLIKSGLISEKQCDESFGEPSGGPRRARWRRQLYEYRNQVKAD